MAKLTDTERSTLMALMARLIEDDDGADEMAAAIEADAAASVERAEVYAQQEADAIEARQAHELALIEAQADATVRVIEADTAGAVAVAAIDAKAATDVAAAVAAPDVLDLDAGTLDAGNEAGDTLDAAAALLSELSADTPDAPAVPLLDPPAVPVADDMLEDVAPAAQHWWTKERGRKRRR